MSRPACFWGFANLPHDVMGGTAGLGLHKTAVPARCGPWYQGPRVIRSPCAARRRLLAHQRAVAGWRAAAAAPGAAAITHAGSAGGPWSPSSNAMAAAGLETLASGRARQGSAPPAVTVRCGSAGGGPYPCPALAPGGAALAAGYQHLVERLDGGAPQGSPPLQGAASRGSGSPHLGASPLCPRLMRSASGAPGEGDLQLYSVTGSPMQALISQGGGTGALPAAARPDAAGSLAAASCAPAALWRQASSHPGMTADPGAGLPGKPGQAVLGRSQSYFSGGEPPGCDAIPAVWPPGTGAAAALGSSGAAGAREQSLGVPSRGQAPGGDTKADSATAAAHALAPHMASLGLGRNPSAHSALALCRDIWGRSAEPLEQ